MMSLATEVVAFFSALLILGAAAIPGFKKNPKMPKYPLRTIEYERLLVCPELEFLAKKWDGIAK